MATKIAWTIIRIERHRGRDVFVHGNSEPMYWLPVSLVCEEPSFIEFSNERSLELKAVVDVKSLAAHQELTAVSPEWFPRDSTVLLQMHHQRFRANIVNMHPEVFKRPKL